jgi:HEPN domain-containing protein
MSDEQLRDDVGRWLRFALIDLRVAELEVAAGALGPSVGCYHAQQAVEKALKAGLLWSKIEPPRRHDLDQLRVLLPPTWLVHNLHPQLGELTEWNAEARYPGDWPEPTERDARDAARQARAWQTVLGDLDRHGFDVRAYR